jgi:lactoylglutathione lyase
MGDVAELRVALTVPDFDKAVAFHRDAAGLAQLADWSTENGRVLVLAAGRATLELFDEAQAAWVDGIEAGKRVSGSVRLALAVADSDEAARRLAAAGAEHVAPRVTTPWKDRNTRLRAPDGRQLTLFSSLLISPDSAVEWSSAHCADRVSGCTASGEVFHGHSFRPASPASVGYEGVGSPSGLSGCGVGKSTLSSPTPATR